MSTHIHSSAIIDPGAELGRDVEIGPFAIVGPGACVGDRCRIAPHATLERNVRLAADIRVGQGSILGGDPQDLKYQGEESWLEIGEGTVIREYATINRGTAASGITRVGRSCFIMSYVHVAHDCVIEDEVVLANAVQLAGHVYVEAHAAIGGSTPIHQFVRIGAHAFVGGGSRVPQDIPPFGKAAGNPLRLYGTNAVGLARAGFDPSVRLALKHAYRLLFNSDLTTSEAIERLRAQADGPPEVRQLVDFVARSERGVLV